MPREVTAGVAEGDGVADGVAWELPRVLLAVGVGVGRLAAVAAGAGVDPPPVGRALGVGSKVAAGTFLCAGSVFVTIFGADAFGSSEPTPGNDNGSSPGEAIKLMPMRTRNPNARAPVSQPTMRRRRRRRPLSSTKTGTASGSGCGSTTI